MGLPAAAELVLFVMGFYMVVSALLHANLFVPEHARDRVVLLTDCTSPLGHQVTLEYAKMGAKLYLIVDDEAKMSKFSRQLLKIGASDVYHYVGTVDDDVKIMQDVNNVYGQLDFLVINHLSSRRLVESRWNDSTNLRDNLQRALYSTVKLAGSALGMLKKSRGHLAVVSSLPGRVSAPTMAAVSAATNAVQAYFASLRQQLKREDALVSVTSVSVGYVNGMRLMVDGWWTQWFAKYGMVKKEEAAWWTTYHVGGRKKEVTYPFAAQFHSWVHSWFPTLYERPPKMEKIMRHVFTALPVVGSSSVAM